MDSNLLKFFEWNERDVLLVNKFGIPEPHKNSKKIIYLIFFLFHC